MLWCDSSGVFFTTTSTSGPPASQTGEESQALDRRATRQKHIWQEQWSRRNKDFSNQCCGCWYWKRAINLPAVPLNLWDHDRALLKLLVNSWPSLHRPHLHQIIFIQGKPHNSRPRRPGFQGLLSPTFSNNAHREKRLFGIKVLIAI